MTTPPGRTQVPAVTTGWSTSAGAWSRPCTTTRMVVPSAVRCRKTMGYGPLRATTPGRLATGSSRASVSGPVPGGSTTRSGPLVAAQVRW